LFLLVPVAKTQAIVLIISVALQSLVFDHASSELRSIDGNVIIENNN
jgi:hypothetical protein